MNTEQTMVNAFVPGEAPLDDESRELIARRERLLGPAYRLMYANPVHIVRGDGVWLYDRNDRAYLDVYNNVASVGHCHPKVVVALSGQAAVLSTNTRYLHHTILDYAQRLLAHFPPVLEHVMFTCTGSEANDLAIRIAEAATGGRGLVVTDNAYHGVTRATAAISPSLGPYAGIGKHVRTVPAPNSYRGDGEPSECFAHHVEQAIEDLRREGIQPCALMVDTVFSSDGLFTQPQGFLAKAVEAMRRAGGLFIADEVQPGFGRTGSHMWGFQRHGVAPDMATLGKPMGNGYPIAGVVAGADVLGEFGHKSRYFNTFGGNTVACAVGLSVLEVIEEEGLMANARDVGDYLQRGLAALAARHRCIGDIRSAGLYLAVEVVDEDNAPDAGTTTRLVNALRARRVLISATGPGANVLKLRPPLVFSRANADLFLQTFGQVLSDL